MHPPQPWKSIVALASAFGMLACKPPCERTVDGKRERNLFRCVSLQLKEVQGKGEGPDVPDAPVMQNVLDHYQLPPSPHPLSPLKVSCETGPGFPCCRPRRSIQSFNHLF
eukprot:COSAG04_NODE_53_length_30631_cov_16.782261_14_plen_110_part_00